MTGHLRLLSIVAIALCLGHPGGSVAAAAAVPPAPGIAVVYPDVGEPYRSVFNQIIGAIDDQARTHLPGFAIGANPNTQAIVAELRRLDIRVVIALGRNGVKLASGLDPDIGVVAGGVISSGEAGTRTFPVFSLAPSPAQLFIRLKSFMPGVRRIFVVFDPAENAWLIRLAKEAASERGIDLVTYEAGDIRTAMRFYKEILTTADAGTDAIWLPQDSNTVDESLVLPTVLQEAWSRNLVFFSSSVGHVRRGALFSLYPNNRELGRHLAESALGYLASGTIPEHGTIPMRNALLAVNVRTAGHLGINLSRVQQRFDLVFPEP